MSAMWAAGLLIVAVLSGVAVTVVHSLLTQEIRAWLPHIARHLVRGAARRLPLESQARYEAEWLAELAAWEDRAISALAKAAHIRWEAKAIRESLGEAGVRGERAKRMLDLSVAVGTLIVLAPICVAIAIAIKLDSRGPVFVKQARVGRRGRSFGLIKFRSMYGDAPTRWEEFMGQWANGDQRDPGVYKDPRLTRVGLIIRRLSLDEVPQLFNVIKGDLSLVGPRPTDATRPEDSQVDGDQTRRPDLRPGLTGPWQINDFLRGSGPPEHEANIDEEYARRRSLLTDMRILVRTVVVILIGRRR